LPSVRSCKVRTRQSPGFVQLKNIQFVRAALIGEMDKLRNACKFRAKSGLGQSTVRRISVALFESMESVGVRETLTTSLCVAEPHLLVRAMIQLWDEPAFPAFVLRLTNEERAWLAIAAAGHEIFMEHFLEKLGSETADAVLDAV